NPALGFVDCEPQSPLQEPRYATLHAVARAPALDEDHHVIGIAHETMPSLFELLVELVEHHVAEQRRQRTPLGDAVPCWKNLLAVENARPQKSTNQLHQPLVRYLATQSRHKTIVVNSIEELLQI